MTSHERVINLTATVRDLLGPVAWTLFSAVLGGIVVLTGNDWVPLLRVLAGIAVAVLLVSAVVTALRSWLGRRGRSLLIAADRLEQVGPAGTQSLRWDDVVSVGLKTGRVGWEGGFRWLAPEMATLELTLEPEAARRVHGELREQHRGGDTYRVLLGSEPSRADQVDQALRTYANEKYGGSERLGKVRSADLL